METEEEVERMKLQSSCGGAAADLLIKAFNNDVQKALDFFYKNDPDDHGEIDDFYVALHCVLFGMAEYKKQENGEKRRENSDLRIGFCLTCKGCGQEVIRLDPMGDEPDLRDPNYCHACLSDPKNV